MSALFSTAYQRLMAIVSNLCSGSMKSEAVFDIHKSFSTVYQALTFPLLTPTHTHGPPKSSPGIVSLVCSCLIFVCSGTISNSVEL